MTAINHALTGAAIGFIVQRPIIALPLALLSHFICDALPHWRTNQPEKTVLRSRWFVRYLFLEVLACVALVAILFANQPLNWQLATLCAFAAASPDLLSFKRFWRQRHRKAWSPGSYVKFASGIQWFERPIGAFVEVAWFIAAVLVIMPFLQ